MNSSHVGTVYIPGASVGVTRLAFGCARIFSGSEAKASAKLIEMALTCGIRHFDTAPSYSNGQSEELLGSVLAGVSDATVATKVGIPQDGRPPSRLGTIYRRALRPVLSQFPGLKVGLLKVLSSRHRAPVAAEPVAAVEVPVARRRLAKDEILRELEGSLTRLRRTRVDILLVHEPDRLELTAEAVEAFADLRQQGVIGAYGRAWDKVVEPVTPSIGPTLEPSLAPSYFGQIIQSRYSQGSATAEAASAPVGRIYHGVLRHAGSADTNRHPSPVDRLQLALDQNPTASFVFSASHSRQITDIAKRIKAQ
jgi:Aldo/keto reductase family